MRVSGPGTTAPSPGAGDPRAGRPGSGRLGSLFSFRGRLGRSQFVLHLIGWHVVVGIGGSLGFALLVGPTLVFAERGWLPGTAMLVLATLATAAYGVGVASFGVRRLHDLGRSGLWLLLALVPLANVALAAALLVVPGTTEENAHGPPDTARRLAFEPATAAFGGVTPADEAAAFAEGRAFAQRQAGSERPVDPA